MSLGATQFALGILLLCACSNSERATKKAGGAVSDLEVVAQVGREPISEEAVAGVMQAKHLSARAAADALVGDSLLGQQLERESPDKASYLRQVALARRLAETIKDEARAEGPPSAEELEEFTRQNWWKIDRPAAAKVAHFVVECHECKDPSAARALAEKIAKSVEGITDPEEFTKRAKEFPAGDAKVTAEVLQPVAADGRIVMLNARPNAQFNFGFYHEEFARAANELTEVGQQSDVVLSASGYHVLLLVEKLPEQRLSREERRDLLEHPILDARARKAREELLAEARKNVSIEVSRSFEQETERLIDLLERR